MGGKLRTHFGPACIADRVGILEGSLTGKKSVPKRQFCKKTACSSYVPPWLAAIGGWRLVTIGGWRLAVGGG